MKLTLLAACLLLAARVDAAPLTWHWSGPVTGYMCETGPCVIGFEPVVPLGTRVDVFVFLDPLVAPADPATPCNRGSASASLQVLGRTYTQTGVVWDEGFGFGPGMCVPGYDMVEVVVPSWASFPELGPALPNGWEPIGGVYLAGLWWPGDLTSVQPASIRSQFPAFHRPWQNGPQRFTVDLEAVTVPEPATWLLLSSGLALARRRRK